MIDTKKKIICIIGLIIIIILIVVLKTKGNNKDNGYSTIQYANNIVYNEMDDSYTIYDSENNIKNVVHSQEEAQKYLENPEYEPDVPEAMNPVGGSSTESDGPGIASSIDDTMPN